MLNETYLANNLRIIREKNGETQEELGNVLGVAHNTIHNYESGKTSPSIDIICRYSDYYGVSVDQLLKRDLSADNQLIPAVVNFDRVISHYEILFPFAQSEIAMKNKLFYETTQLNSKLNGLISSPASMGEPLLKKGLNDSYIVAAKDGLPEAAINAIRFYLLYYLSTLTKGMEGELLHILKSGNSIQLMSKTARKILNREDQLIDKEIAKLREKWEIDIIQLFSIVEKSETWVDLGNYYNFWYLITGIFCFVDSKDNSMVMGTNILLQEYLKNNPYVINLLHFYFPEHIKSDS